MKRRINFLLSIDALDMLKELAASKGLSMTSTVETLIREAVKKNTKKTTPAP